MKLKTKEQYEINERMSSFVDAGEEFRVWPLLLLLKGLLWFLKGLLLCLDGLRTSRSKRHCNVVDIFLGDPVDENCTFSAPIFELISDSSLARVYYNMFTNFLQPQQEGQKGDNVLMFPVYHIAVKGQVRMVVMSDVEACGTFVNSQLFGQEQSLG